MMACLEGKKFDQIAALIESSQALRKRKRRITLGADKAYDATTFVEDLRAR
jgi:hypothetical protein